MPLWSHKQRVLCNSYFAFITSLCNDTLHNYARFLVCDVCEVWEVFKRDTCCYIKCIKNVSPFIERGLRDWEQQLLKEFNV